MRFLIALILFFFALTAEAQDGGKYVYSFLSNPNSARVAANGGILPSHNSASANLVWQNPAELRASQHNKSSLGYISYFDDVSAASASYVFDSKSFGLFSAQIQRMGYGEFIAADEFGERTGTFQVNDNAIGVSWAYPLLDSLVFVGVTTKGIFSNYEQYSSTALATDWGISYHSKNQQLAIGLTVRNLGFQVKPFTEDNYEDLPLQINLGISKKLAHAPFRINLTLHDLQKWNLDYSDAENSKESSLATEILKHFNVGIEFAASEKFFAALSYNFKRRNEMQLENGTGMSGFAWGFGMSIKMFRISFANTYFHRAGSAQLFSIGVDFSRFKR